MARTFKCKHCGKRVRRNPRLKSGQRYCNDVSCQAARKKNWERDKRQQDTGYRLRRRKTKAQWRKHYPAYVYQKRYRESHPNYVQINREKQQKRNEKRKHSHSVAKIVKTDALLSQGLITSGLYELLPYKKHESEKIVKTDALMVQLSVLQYNKAHLVRPLR